MSDRLMSIWRLVWSSRMPRVVARLVMLNRIWHGKKATSPTGLPIKKVNIKPWVLSLPKYFHSLYFAVTTLDVDTKTMSLMDNLRHNIFSDLSQLPSAWSKTSQKNMKLPFSFIKYSVWFNTEFLVIFFIVVEGLLNSLIFLYYRYAVIATECAGCPKIKCERPGCNTHFCYHCKQHWHPNKTCDAARAERAMMAVTNGSMNYSPDSESQGKLLDLYH